MTHLLQNINQTQKWVSTLGSGLSLFCVLYLFRGYHIEESISSSGHGLLLRTSLFALLSVLIFYCFEFRFNQRLTNTWLKRLLPIFIGAVATFLLFNYFWQWSEWTFPAFVLLLFEYTLVMIFPLLLSYAVGWREKDKDSTPHDFLHLRSSNNKHRLSLKPTQLLLVKAADNYVEVYYQYGEEIKQELLRTSLKKLEQDNRLSNYLKRCHRSYLINPKHIEAQQVKKGRMHLRIGKTQVPVSQTYQSAFI